MRRGLLKDLANTPTRIACGWRMYGDLERLASWDGAVIVVDLLSGAVTQDGHEFSSTLFLADDVVGWMRERLERDGVPSGTITAATLTLRPSLDSRRHLVVHCSTILRTVSATYESEDVTRWHPGDVKGA